MAKYFYGGVTDWGFIDMDGHIISGLDFADPMIDNHSALARRLKLGKSSMHAVKAGCIRYAVEIEGESLFIQYERDDDIITRRIANLMRHTGAKSINGSR